jgi:hypothetical protein
MSEGCRLLGDQALHEPEPFHLPCSQRVLRRAIRLPTPSLSPQRGKRLAGVLRNHGCLLSTYFIEHHFPRGIQLLQQVEVPNIAGQ